MVHNRYARVHDSGHSQKQKRALILLVSGMRQTEAGIRQSTSAGIQDSTISQRNKTNEQLACQRARGRCFEKAASQNRALLPLLLLCAPFSLRQQIGVPQKVRLFSVRGHQVLEPALTTRVFGIADIPAILQVLEV